MDNAHTSVRAAESPDGARRANANISPTVIGRAKYPFTPRLCVGPCTLHACLSLPPLLLPPPLSLSLYLSLSVSLQHLVHLHLDLSSILVFLSALALGAF